MTNLGAEYGVLLSRRKLGDTLIGEDERPGAQGPTGLSRAAPWRSAYRLVQRVVDQAVWPLALRRGDSTDRPRTRHPVLVGLADDGERPSRTSPTLRSQKPGIARPPVQP